MKPWKYVWTPQQSILNIHRPTSHLISPAVISLYSDGFLFFNGICVHTIFLPDIRDGATYCIWAVLLDPASNLVIDINPTALPTTRQEIKVQAEWLSQVLRVWMNLHKSRSEDQNSSAKVTPVWLAAASSGMCCRNTLCLLAAGSVQLEGGWHWEFTGLQGVALYFSNRCG